MPLDPRAEALRATANPEGGTNVILPRQIRPDPRVQALRTFDPSAGKLAPPGPPMMRPDNEALYDRLSYQPNMMPISPPAVQPPSPVAPPPSQPPPPIAPPPVTQPPPLLPPEITPPPPSPAAPPPPPPPPPPVVPSGPEEIYKNPEYFEPYGDNTSGAAEYLQPVVNPTVAPPYIGPGLSTPQTIVPDTKYYQNPEWFEPSGDNWSGANQYITEAELKAQTEAANSEYDQWGIFQGGGR